jgi:hypothetical protein
MRVFNTMNNSRKKTKLIDEDSDSDIDNKKRYEGFIKMLAKSNFT